MHSSDASAGQSLAKELIAKNYSEILNVSSTPLLSFFYPIMVSTFWGDDAGTIDYISLLVADKFFMMKNIPHTRKEFTSYVHERKLRPSEYGDLALLNAGILHRYTAMRRKALGMDYFRDVGQKQYALAAGPWQGVYDRLANQFTHYEEGLRTISDEYIYGRPVGLLMDQLIDAGVAAKRNPNEENLLRLDRIRNLGSP